MEVLDARVAAPPAAVAGPRNRSAREAVWWSPSVGAVAALGFGVLVASLWHRRGVTGVDVALVGSDGPDARDASFVANVFALLGSPVSMVLAGAGIFGLVGLQARTRAALDVRAAGLLAAAPLAAAAFGDIVIKPVVARREIYTDILWFPSAHITGVAAAALIVFALRPTRNVLLCCAAAIGVACWAQVAGGRHLPTDVLGGLLLGATVAMAAIGITRRWMSRTRFFKVIGAAVAALLLGAVAAPAATPATDLRQVYGKPTAPQDLTRIIANAKPGERVIVHGGDYAGFVIADRAFSPPLQVIVMPGDNARVPSIELRNVENVNIEGFTVSGTMRVIGGKGVTLKRNTVAGPDKGPDAAISVESGASDVTIANNQVTSGKRNVLLFAGTGSPARVTNVHITANDLGSARSDAIQVIGADNAVIEKNFIHNLVENADHNDGVQAVDSTHLSIIGNVFTSPGKLDADQGIMLGPMAGARVSDTRIENNVIHHWRGAGINVNGARNTLIVNNSVTDTGEPGHPWPALNVAETPSPGLRIWNNILSSISRVEGSAAPQLEDHNCVAVGGTGAHDVAVVPDLSADTGFALAPKSPCIGAGIADGAPAVDHFGRQRTRAIDAGAVAFNTTDKASAAQAQTSSAAAGKSASIPAGALHHTASVAATSRSIPVAVVVVAAVVLGMFFTVVAAAVVVRRRTPGGIQ